MAQNVRRGGKGGSPQPDKKPYRLKKQQRGKKKKKEKDDMGQKERVLPPEGNVPLLQEGKKRHPSSGGGKRGGKKLIWAPTDATFPPFSAKRYPGKWKDFPVITREKRRKK